MTSSPSSLIPALWIAWLIYWCIESLRAQPVRQEESVSSRLSHTVPLVIGIALMVSPRWTPAWLSGRALPRSELTLWIGVALLVVGLAFSVWARRHLAGWWSSAVTLKQDHQLIRTGPYRWARHPIYTGLLVGLLGTAIAAGEWRGFLGVALVAAAFLRKISIEEQFLSEAFPGDYDRYRAEVAALIPFVY
jgi:protein-S-isoprenylcysteine O-methyltransferase Ste14